MTYGSEDRLRINCANYRNWLARCDILSLLQSVAIEQYRWPALVPNNNSARTVDQRRRFPGHRLAGEVRRIFTDATPQEVGEGGWRI